MRVAEENKTNEIVEGARVGYRAAVLTTYFKAPESDPRWAAEGTVRSVRKLGLSMVPVIEWEMTKPFLSAIPPMEFVAVVGSPEWAGAAFERPAEAPSEPEPVAVEA